MFKEPVFVALSTEPFSFCMFIIEKEKKTDIRSSNKQKN